MSKSSKEPKVSRREFLKTASGIAALPFALAIPSRATEVVTELDALRPYKEREDAFLGALNNKLAQMGVPRPPLPQQYPKPLPPRTTVNTSYDTTQNTSTATTTTSASPPRSDDTNTDTHHDGTKEDFKTDNI